MLSIHGLLIIASEVQEVKSLNQFGSIITFQVSTETIFKTTIRHLIEVFVSSNQLDELKSKVIIGNICEVTHGQFYESYKNVKNGNKELSNVIIKVEYKNLKFLSLCIYYENLPKITSVGEK